MKNLNRTDIALCFLTAAFFTALSSPSFAIAELASLDNRPGLLLQSTAHTSSPWDLKRQKLEQIHGDSLTKKGLSVIDERKLNEHRSRFKSALRKDHSDTELRLRSAYEAAQKRQLNSHH